MRWILQCADKRRLRGEDGMNWKRIVSQSCDIVKHLRLAISSSGGMYDAVPLPLDLSH